MTVNTLSVIIPVFNSWTIERLIEKLTIILKDLDITFEIVIVDDGSDDKTRDVLTQLALKEQIRLFFHDRNLGQSAAIVTGLEKVQGQFILLIDDDLDYDLHSIPDFLAQLQAGNDLINGRRIERHYRSVLYRVASTIMNGWLFLLSPCHLRDCCSPVKCFRRKVVQQFTLTPSMKKFPQEVLALHIRKAVELPLSMSHKLMDHPSRYQFLSLARLFLSLLFFSLVWYCRRMLIPENTIGFD